MRVACLVACAPGWESTLALALHSIALQEHPYDEVHVAYDRQLRGIVANLHDLLSKVDCDYFVCVGADDYLPPHNLKELLAVHTQTDADVVYGHCVTYPWPQNWDEEQLRAGNYICGGGALMRTSLVRSVGAWPVPFADWPPGQAHLTDWGLWLRLLAVDATFAYAPLAHFYTDPTRHTAGRTEGMEQYANSRDWLRYYAVGSNHA